MTERRRLDVNNELTVVANCGIYQWIILVITGFLTLTFALQMFVSVFTHGDQEFRYVDQTISLSLYAAC